MHGVAIAVRKTVHRDQAIAAAHYAWNTEHRDCVSSLPSELCAACFQYLSLKERVAASHVSRDWRAMLLSEPALWAQFSFRFGMSDLSAETCLSVLLDRSRSAKFRLDWSNRLGRLPDRCLGLIAEHMHRIQSLTISQWGDPHKVNGTLLDKDLSQLEFLTLSGSLRIPRSWTLRPPAALRALDVGSLENLPDNYTIESLRTIRFRERCSLELDRIFALAPSLEHLELSTVPNPQQLFYPLAPSLRSFVIMTHPAIDFGRYVSRWANSTHHLKLLRLSLSKNLTPAGSLFTGGSWTMSTIWEQDFMSVISRTSDGLRIEQNVEVRSAETGVETNPFLGLQAQFSRLTALWIDKPGRILQYWLATRAACPALASLTLYMAKGQDDASHMLHLVQELSASPQPTRACIAPCLRTIALVFLRDPEVIPYAVHIMVRIRYIVAFDAEIIPRLELTLRAGALPRQTDFSELFPYSHELYIQDNAFPRGAIVARGDHTGRG